MSVTETCKNNCSHIFWLDSSQRPVSWFRLCETFHTVVLRCSFFYPRALQAFLNVNKHGSTKTHRTGSEAVWQKPTRPVAAPVPLLSPDTWGFYRPEGETPPQSCTNSRRKQKTVAHISRRSKHLDGQTCTWTRGVSMTDVRVRRLSFSGCTKCQVIGCLSTRPSLVITFWAQLLTAVPLTGFRYPPPPPWSIYEAPVWQSIHILKGRKLWITNNLQRLLSSTDDIVEDYSAMLFFLKL